MILIRYTDSPDFSSTEKQFAADVPDPELHELSGTRAHFVIDPAGTIRCSSHFQSHVATPSG